MNSRVVKIIPTATDSGKENIATAILSAGIGSRIKSYEPRSLIKIGKKTLIDIQISMLNNALDHPEIIGVFGCHIGKICKKIRGKIRIVENQMYDQTNTSESMRLAFNNTTKQKFLFFHGDLYFNMDTLKDLDYGKSFIIVDTNNKMSDKEIGVTICDNKASILSYGLPIKWCQMAYITGKEYRILKTIFNKFTHVQKKLLSFEILNMMIDMGATFYCYEPKKMSIIEIDCKKDLNNENFNI